MCEDNDKRIMFSEYLGLLPVNDGDALWASTVLPLCFGGEKDEKFKTRLHYIPAKYVFKVCSTLAIVHALEMS